ncbi:MAG: glycosyltransferase family 4 protein [Acidimicrobiales bacterium]|nr:glycosyltransferase family 4 protein [Acidimicrobiales bacterium]
MSSERILVVSPYPPIRDGIGSYAVQQVRALRRAGNHVEVCSPEPSAAHHHLDTRGPKGALALGRLARRFDRTILHFHPDFFYEIPATPTSRLTTGTALALALRTAGNVTIVLHEVDHRWAAPTDPSAKATRAVFRAAAEVAVHVPEHRRMMVEEFGVPAERVTLVDHGGDFVARVPDDRAEARRILGLPADGHVFLCIGFVQPHKGFDRAVAAFGDLGSAGASLYVVGSVRVDDPLTADHVAELERLAARTPGAHLRLSYVSDDRFDRWIVAADTVVLPYREIWSSSVAERARLYGRPVIASRVGGLADQLADAPGIQLVDDNVALALAMRRAVSGAASGSPADGSTERASAAWSFADGVDRESVQAEVRRRAGTGSASRAARRATSAAGTGSASSPLRRVPTLSLPPAASARPGVSTVKKLIRRVIGWELDPIREQVSRIQRATVESVDVLDARVDELEDP